MSAYFLYTGHTQAQTQIDTDHTTAWLLTAASAWTLGGGRFVMKRGSATAGDVSLVVRAGSASGTEIARVTLTPASFTSIFTEVAFDFATPLSLQAGTSYYIAIESSVPDVQSEAYFIKGVRETSFEDLSRNVLSPSAYQISFGGTATTLPGIDAISADTGASATDFVTSQAQQTVTATLDAALLTGDTLSGSVDNGSTWTDISAFANGTDVTWTGVTLNGGTDGSNTLQIKIERSGGSTTVLTQDYTLDSTAPAQAITIDSISADSGTAGDFITNTAAQTVSATLDAALQGDETLYGSLDNGTTWTDVTAKVSGTTVTWSGVSLNGGVDGSNTLRFVIKDAAGNAGKAASQAYTLDSATPSQTVFIDSISVDSGTAGDFITNTAAQTVAGHLGAKLGNGDVLEGSLDNGTTWTDITAHVSGTAISWTGTTLNGGQDGSNTLRLRVSDAAGNTGGSAIQAYTLDTTAPTQAITIDSISADSGTAGDFITNTPAQTVSATLDAALQGDETLYGSLDDGTTWTDVTAKVSGTTVTWSGVSLNGGVDGSNTLRFVIKDAAGNAGKAASQAYTLDSATPSQTVFIDSISVDSGTAGDFITNTAAQTVAGHLGAKLGNGDVLEGSLDNGTTWADITAHVSGTTINWTGTTLNGGQDGSNTLRLRVSDTAGNTGASASQAYTLDSTAPSQSLTIVQLSNDTGTAGDFITSVAGQTITATLGGTLAADERLEGSLDNGTTWTDITAKVTGTGVSWSGTTLNGGVDGSNTLRLRLLDRAGNTGTTASQAYTLDRVAPAQKISITGLSADTGKAGDFITGTAAQTISGTLSAALGSGDVLQGSLDNGATWTDITAMVSGTAISWTGATLNTGTSAIRLRLADQAGNTGNSASRAYTLDTTPPPVPTDFDISAATDTGANDRTTAHNMPVIGFSSEAGLVITLAGPAGGVLTQGAAGHYQLAASGTRYTATLLDARPTQAGRQPFGTFANGKATGNAADIADGTYTFTGTDLAGNQSTLGSFVIDTTAPAAPTDLDISAATDTGANDLRTWNGRPVLTFTAESGLAVVLKGASGATLTQGPTAQYSLAEAAQGGGRSLYTVTLLDADPSRTGSQPYGTFAAGAATKNAANVADGTYTFTGTDTAGNSATLGSFVIATSLAQPRVTQLPKNGAAIGLAQRLAGLSCDDITRSATVSGTAEPNATLRLFDMAGLPGANSTPVATVTADGAGRWSATLPALAQGAHHIVAQQVDANGTVGGYGFYDFIHDTRAPVVTETLARNAAGRISQASGTGEAGLRVELSNGTATIGTATVGVTGKWSFLPPASVAASSGLIAAQTDFAGNLGVAVAGSGMTYTVPAGRIVAVRNTGLNTVVRLDASVAEVMLDLGSDPNWRLDLIGLGGTYANAAAVRSALVPAGSGSMLTLPSGGTVQFANLAPSSPLFDSTHLRLI